jgi:GNAT superfamily N-acetyltransferase
MGDADDIVVRELREEEREEAVGVVARGMRDNPLHVAAYGEDPEWRERCHAKLVRAMFSVFDAHRWSCAVGGEGAILGVSGEALPGRCQPDAGQRLQMVPKMLGLGPRTAARVGRWISRWSANDPDEPHVHFGPVAVDRDWQGNGIGSLVLNAHCRGLDAEGAAGYLETDKERNVRFYERFGYVVTAEEPVLGVPNWFMHRSPRPGTSG